jgi:hypothetical protein
LPAPDKLLRSISQSALILRVVALSIRRILVGRRKEGRVDEVKKKSAESQDSADASVSQSELRPDQATRRRI